MKPRQRTVFRSLDGLLLLDKPAGLSSNQALQRVRHLFRADKGGHTGSLDPLATGLLPICFGEATKIAGLLLGNRKAYAAEVRLGVTTDTDDADGQVLRERVPEGLSLTRIEAALVPFLGRIRQRPPIYSALKQGGEPLYAKARRGEVIEVAEREVEIDAIRITRLEGADLQMDVVCGSGTYIRSLARDLGEALGCGGHITALRRLWVEPFVQPRMYTLEQLQALAGEGEDELLACLLPIEAGLVGWPTLTVDAESCRRLGQGQAVQLGPEAPRGEVNITDLAGRSQGLGDVDESGLLRPRRLFRWAAEAAAGTRARPAAAG